MGYKTVRATKPVRHNNVLRVPGQTTGENAQDFVVSDASSDRLVALGVVTVLGVAAEPEVVEPVGRIFARKRGGVVIGLQDENGLALAAGGASSILSITGVPGVGNVYTAILAAGWGGSPTYQWLRGVSGANDLVGASTIAGATASTYTQVEADAGCLIGCRVAGVTQYSAAATALVPAIPVEPVVGVAPAFTTAPAIIGTPTVGVPVSFTPGTVTGTTPITRAVQWLLDGAQIVGETEPTYTPISGDATKALSVRETASNGTAPNAVAVSSGMVVAAAGGGTPVTITATGTEFLAAASASYRVTAGKLYLKATSGSENVSAFTFMVKGSDATLTLQNDASYYDGAVLVSVDGGAHTTAANVGATYTLFSGLTDAWHKISIKTGGIWGANNLHLVPSAAVLSVTGVGAGWLAPTEWLHPGDVNPLIHTTGALINNLTDYVPAKLMEAPVASVSNVGTIRFKAAATKIFIFASAPFVFYSRNGGAPVRVSVPGNGTVIEGFDGTEAIYNVWSSSGYYLSAGTDAPVVDVGLKKSMAQFGNSITAGDSLVGSADQNRGDVDTLGVAAALGFAGETYGLSGQTIATLATNIGIILAALPPAGPLDVAVLSIGRNDLAGGMDSTEQADYNSIVDDLVAHGYGRVLCRGVLPEGATVYTAFNSTIESLVTSRADPKVVYINTNTWAGIATGDGVHPTIAGYATIRAFAIPAYTPHMPV